VELIDAVRAAQRGDQEAFRMVYHQVQPGLLRYLYRLVGPEAEDVASETWLQTARDLSRFAGDEIDFRAWVTTIARNRAMDHLRAKRRRPTCPMNEEDLVDYADPQDTAGAALHSVATDAAMALIATLPRDQAEAVWLRVVMGLDSKSAATVLGKRSGAVRTAAYRGLRRLAQQLEPECLMFRATDSIGPE
jgi:RNA polymerase sigma-70 factor, ECF subfamily